MNEPSEIPSKNLQINAYLSEDRPLKFHETRMLEILRETLGDFKGSLLDVGCASGLFLASLRLAFPTANLRGIELNSRLIDLARRRLSNSHVLIEEANAAAYRPPEPVDCVVASAILSVFHDPLAVLDHWLSWVKPGGHLFVFGRFNSRRIDTRVEYRSRFNDEGWETGLTSFAVSTIQEHLADRQLSATFERFVFPEDLKESDDPIRHYTIKTENGDRIMMNGANIIAEQYYLTVKKLK